MFSTNGNVGTRLGLADSACGYSGVVQFAHLHRVLLPGDAGLGIFEVLERGVDVAFEQETVRKAPGVSDFEGQLARKFAREAGVEHVRIGRLQVGCDAHELAGDGCDVRRRDRKGFGGRRSQNWSRTVVARAGGEAVRVGKLPDVAMPMDPY